MALTYYITARQQLGAGVKSPALEEALRAKVRTAFAAGVDYVQLREKDLSGRPLALLVEELASCKEKTTTRVLVNERLDIAISCGADGVHLPSGGLPVRVAKSLAAGMQILGLSCHNEDEALEAADSGASYILLAPVFATPSKPGAKPLGLELLQNVCRRSAVPVIALGGVNAENAEACIRAGAAGVAGIRLFQQAEDLAQLCGRLRAL